MPVEVKLNTWYQTRAGRLVKIETLSEDRNDVDPFKSDTGDAYYPEGTFYPPHLNTADARDLVREVSHIGVLLEIICKEGLYFSIGNINESKIDVVVAEKMEDAFDLIGKYVCVNCEIHELFDTAISVYLKYVRMHKQ